jgi:hypothetical protein
MPAAEAFDGEEMEGEMQGGNPADPPAPYDKPHFITIVPESPIRIDLLKLDNDRRFARFLNRFDSVPSGVYDKIRVHYRDVKVVLANGETLRFHPTAHSKFDILLRPQIFAVAGDGILYSVAGTAGNVNRIPALPVSGTFDVLFGAESGNPRTIPVVFDNNAAWAYSDDVLGHSHWIVDNVAKTTAVSAFDNDARVMAVGAFDASGTLHASDIVFSFPFVREGRADNVWIPPDNVAFVVRSGADNVMVFPRPDRYGAYYDNAATHDQMDQSAVDNGVHVKARGYFRTSTISGIDAFVDAFWISVGDPSTVGP